MCHFLKQAMLYCLLISAVGVVTTSADETAGVPRMPMEINYENTTTHRWLEKGVPKSRLLDDMEQPDNWSHPGQGEMSFTQQRCKDGKQSIRLTCPTRVDDPNYNGGLFGYSSVHRSFPGLDFSDYNRLSFWIYPDVEGLRTIYLTTFFYNEGTVKVPGPYGRNGRSHFILKPNQWNHIVWEIEHLSRDKVTGIALAYLLLGNEPGARESICYDLDCLELQKVEPDHFEGWNVAPGKITFSHTGYPLGASKTAFASDLTAESFKLIDVATNHAVITKPVQTVESHIGKFQVMDFSEVRQPGTYIIKAGKRKTQPFSISENVWRDTIWKTINFFYCERCGTEIPGVHGSCHRDWQIVHNDKTVIMNGGWHDAGDLSQGTVNTSEAAYAMFSLADRLQKTDPVLAERLIEEGRWGLDWLLKTQFEDGYRVGGIVGMSIWSDGIIGTNDDIIYKARNSPFENFLAASTEAVAGRVLKEIDPILSSYAIKAAEKDWRFAVEKAQSPHLELTGAAAVASLDLFEATGKQLYADKAFEMARVFRRSQQRNLPSPQAPLTGFFYTSPAKARAFYAHHRSHVQGPAVALARLCEMFPNHPDWIKWYSAVVLHSEYLKEISKYTEPYAMLPNALYCPDELDKPTFREQVLTGIKLGEKHYLRLFPVWYGLRGNHGTLLSQTKGLSMAAHTRRNPELADLCQKQLQWVVGRNPFVQSTMYGEGYDYAPQYTISSGDMVGSLPVGIQTNVHSDKPYWPADNCYNYKEVWVHPSSRWLWLMCDLAGPAQVTGRLPKADQSVEFIEVTTGKTTTVKAKPDSGQFSAQLPEGHYRLRYGRQERSVTLLPGESVDLDLRQRFDFSVSQATLPDGNVTIKIDVEGEGNVEFVIRADNLSVAQGKLKAKLKPRKPQTLTCQAKVISTDQPWVAVVVPNDDLSRRKELFSFAE